MIGHQGTSVLLQNPLYCIVKDEEEDFEVQSTEGTGECLAPMEDGRCLMADV